MGIKGIDQEAGVFVVAKREDEFVARDFEYLKKGKGPYYLFFRDHHLCYFEAVRSIAEAALFGVATIPHRKKMADVFAVAKRDIRSAENLDGIGGSCVYGLIDKAQIVRDENFLPVGLSAYSVARKDIKKDTLVTYDMVDFPSENCAVRLRKKEDALSTITEAQPL